MKRVKLIKPKIKDNKALNNPVKLYAYTREGGSTNYGCRPPEILNKNCRKSFKI